MKIQPTMKKLLLASTLLATLALSAQAADLGYRKPAMSAVPMLAAYNWTGFYVGLQGGGAFGGSNRHDSGGARSGTFGISGGLVGGTLGYNYQLSNNVVLGAEGDYAWSGIKGSTAVNCVAPGCRTDVRSFGTARLRAGYAFDRVLPYITGGLALGDVRGRVGTPSLSGSEYRAGWAVGAGVEAAVWQNVTAKVEYLYYDLGKFSYTPGISTTAKGHLVRAGLNYRF